MSWQSSFHPRTRAWDLQPSAGPSACSCRYVKRENVEDLTGSFHGPGLEVEHVISAMFYWQELSRVVFPNNKGG